ncbi:MAG: hypothetical protein D6798_19340 [Deltaproteobacteria bacterium]|nr:MAG: hypothetical protein D6798_19340 [Deltaproteobacteria bacterium]
MRPPAARSVAELLERAGLPLLLLTTVAAYLGLIHAGFVWDDEALVVRNTVTGSLANIPRFFTMDLWDGAPVQQGVSGYYRPLVLVSFAVDRALFGMAPAGHHLHSLAWHLLAVTMACRLLRNVVSPRAALVAAAVMALHPAQSEAVAWIAARNDPMATALGLAALACVMPADAGPARLVGGGLLTLAALLTKESVILLPALLLVLDLARGGARPVRRYVPLVVGIGVGVGMRLAAGVGAATAPPPEGWLLLGRRALQVAGVYGAAITVPWPLSGARSLEWLDQEPAWRTVVGCLSLSLFLALPLVLRGARRRVAIAGVLWWALAVLPTLIPVADKGVIGDRYGYLGMVGVGLWLVSSVPRLAPVLVAAALPAWLWILHDRLPDWVDDLSLWTAANEDTPSPYTQASLGHILLMEGHPDLALPLFIQSLAGEPPSTEGCVSVMVAADALGRPAEAARLGEWALSRGCPRTGEHLGELALLQARLGRWEEARATLVDAPRDFRDRDVLVRAALAWRDGDADTYERMEARWVDIFPLQDKVQELLAEAAVRAGASPPPEPEP